MTPSSGGESVANSGQHQVAQRFFAKHGLFSLRDAHAQASPAAPDLIENGDRPQPRNALEQRHHLAVPNRGQRILPPAPARRSLLRREPEVLLKAIGSGSAEPGLCCGNRRRVGLAEAHVQPRLAIGDVAPGQAAVPHRREEPASYRPTATPENTAPCEAVPAVKFATSVALRPPFVANPATLSYPDRRAFLIPSVAQHGLRRLRGLIPRNGVSVVRYSSCPMSAAFASLAPRDRMISSSRSTLCRFFSLYAALYAGFGVQSPYLPILLDSRHLSPETIALALAAGTAMRLMAAPAVARLADRFDAPRSILAFAQPRRG